MIYITQLIYLKDNQEKLFDEFERIAIPLIARYSGKLLCRIRPTSDSVIEINMEQPYEIHLVEFPTENDFEQFMRDEERKSFLHLKEKAIKAAWLIKGNRL